MPLPDIQRKQVEQKIEDFCKTRVPQELRHKKRLNYKIRGNSVTIIEYQPFLPNSKEWIDVPLAQIRFNETDGTWTLYYPDRNCRWHEYYDADTEKELDPLLQEIADDPTGIFGAWML